MARTREDVIEDAVDNKALDLFFGVHRHYPETDADWLWLDDSKVGVRFDYRWDEDEERLMRR